MLKKKKDQIEKHTLETRNSKGRPNRFGKDPNIASTNEKKIKT